MVTYGNEKRRVGSDAEPALHPAANVAAFVLKAPALDRHVEAGGCTDPECGLCDR